MTVQAPALADRMAGLAERVRARQDTLLTVCFGGVGAWLLTEGILELA